MLLDNAPQQASSPTGFTCHITLQTHTQQNNGNHKQQHHHPLPLPPRRPIQRRLEQRKRSNSNLLLAVPLKPPSLINTFLCHCADCHKLTSSMFTSNFTALASSVRHIRGQRNLKTLKQDKTPSSGSAVTNYTCGTCGSLMYRVSEAFPAIMVLRTGTVDDFELHGSVFRPGVEVFTTCRRDWVGPVEGAMQDEGLFFKVREV
ncbi:Mss4-like protein [Aspergillus venezuelensis]